MLYQRYFLRMNQNNAAHIVWLLFALIFILTIIHVHFSMTRWNAVWNCSNTTIRNDNETLNKTLIDAANSSMFYNETVNENITTQQNQINDNLEFILPLESMVESTCKQTHDTHFVLGTSILQLSLLGLCSILYTILLLCLYKQRINEIYLFHVSYAIIISLVAIDISFSITNLGK